jgi:hypothetical protein
MAHLWYLSETVRGGFPSFELQMLLCHMFLNGCSFNEMG